jgi:hypothetical protein
MVSNFNEPEYNINDFTKGIKGGSQKEVLKRN